MNRFGDGFAPLLVEVLKIEFFECHGVKLSPLNIVRQPDGRDLDEATTEVGVTHFHRQQQGSGAIEALYQNVSSHYSSYPTPSQAVHWTLVLFAIVSVCVN